MQLAYYSIVEISIMAGFIAGYFTWASSLFNGQEPFPFLPPSHAFMALAAIFLGAMLFLCVRTASGEEQKSLWGYNVFMRVLISIMAGIGLILVFKQPALGSLHPIDLLIYDNRLHHDAWLSQARGSRNLAGAVQEYRRRYNQHPPP